MQNVQTLINTVEILMVLATVVVGVLLVSFIAVWRQSCRAFAELDAAQTMYEGQFAAVWQEGYRAGIEDERTAADYNVGSSEMVAANRVNPYAAEAGAR